MPLPINATAAMPLLVHAITGRAHFPERRFSGTKAMTFFKFSCLSLCFYSKQEKSSFSARLVSMAFRKIVFFWMGATCTAERTRKFTSICAWCDGSCCCGPLIVLMKGSTTLTKSTALQRHHVQYFWVMTSGR